MEKDCSFKQGEGLTGRLTFHQRSEGGKGGNMHISRKQVFHEEATALKAMRQEGHGGVCRDREKTNETRAEE